MIALERAVECQNDAGPRPVIMTVGHSRRSLDEFLGLLEAHAVTRVVDVRREARSHLNAQFDGDILRGALAAVGIRHTHAAGLGGFRRGHARSPNRGWRDASLRGFADYMQTREFTDSLDELIASAASEQVALMCAETAPWRCHRSLIADALVARDIPVEEIISGTCRQVHALTPLARVEGQVITYPPRAPRLLMNVVRPVEAHTPA